MSPRKPSPALVVDANILLSALKGRKTWGRLRVVGVARAVVATERARDEVLRVLDRLQASQAEIRSAHTLLAEIEICPAGDYEPLVDRAAAFLARAPASRTGSTADAHILALAWTLDADIWSHDRDFAGTGWPSWSSANLIDALAGEAAA